MTDDTTSLEARSSGDLWSEICSNLPQSQEQEGADESFTDSFQPHFQESNQNNQSSRNAANQWEPMADSAVYIASLGTGPFYINLHDLCSFCLWTIVSFNVCEHVWVTESRLKRVKGQSNEVTSREMLRSLSQAKKECWDRFLHDAQTSELFQEGDLDERQVVFILLY